VQPREAASKRTRWVGRLALSPIIITGTGFRLLGTYFLGTGPSKLIPASLGNNLDSSIIMAITFNSGR